MTQKKAQRQRKPSAAAPEQPAGRREAQSADSLRAECEKLKNELAAARGELAMLRKRQQDVLDRIDWALDSIESLANVEV